MSPPRPWVEGGVRPSDMLISTASSAPPYCLAEANHDMGLTLEWQPWDSQVQGCSFEEESRHRHKEAYILRILPGSAAAAAR